MNLTRVLAEDRRLVVLRTLSEVSGYALNEDVLRQALVAIGHPEAARDFVRQDIEFLAEHGLVRKETMHLPSGELWVVHLMESGQEVAKGRMHVGVARLTPGA
ncbi:MAG TPA: ArsR family transcriptional regulator [Gammaproteobacteria bacterium]|nr:ArsR family transcriptional regulator [Gammaproteobacteria bacterium]